MKRSTGGLGWGKDKKEKKRKKREGHRRVEVSGGEARKEKVTRCRAGGKNREEEEEEDVTGRRCVTPRVSPASQLLFGNKKKEGLIKSAISPCCAC